MPVNQTLYLISISLLKESETYHFIVTLAHRLCAIKMGIGRKTYPQGKLSSVHLLSALPLEAQDKQNVHNSHLLDRRTSLYLSDRPQNKYLNQITFY